MGSGSQSEAVDTDVAHRREVRQAAGVDLEIYSGGQGERLLILHDCEYLNEWQPFHTGLAEQFSVMAPSHPGFGGSKLPERFDSIEDLAYFYLDLVREMGPEPVHLMGMGIGGWIAAEMAVRSTEGLGRLVLVDSVGIKVSDRTTRDIADTFVVDADAIVSMAWHDAERGRQLMKYPGQAGLQEQELLTLLRNRQTTALLTWKPFMHNPKLRARLARIDVPTLVVWGESDGITTLAYGQAFAESIPGAELRTIPAAGHYPYLERPEQFLKVVTPFLQASERNARSRGSVA